MLISLDPNGEEFAKQVARVRRGLSVFVAANGPISPERDQQACSARLMAVSFVPFLTALRVELMKLGQEDGASPDQIVTEIAQIVTAVADLCANIALTAVQSLFDAPPLVVAEEVEKCLIHATHVACQSIAADAAKANVADTAKMRPIFSVIDGGRSDIATKTVIHDQRTEDCQGEPS